MTNLGTVWVTGLVILQFLIAPVFCSQVRYDNYRLYRVFPEDKRQVDLLGEMQANSDSLIFLNQNRKFAQILVAPHRIGDFEKILREEADVSLVLDSENVQELIDEERRVNFLRGDKSQFGWTRYHELHEINEWLYRQEGLHPKIASVRVIGRTHEKRDILAFKISNGGPGNKAVFFESGIHAREWISPAVATYIINELLNNNSSDVQRIAQRYDWYFVVNTNPDGYVYTQTDRFWRKNRKPYGSCYGADPNRNFNSSWGSVGVSRNPCSDIFPGRHANSEREIAALSSYIGQIPELRLYISFHSYSQLLLYPYGYKEDVPDNIEDISEIADKSVKALSRRYGTQYEHGTIPKILYPVSGSSIDWILDSTRTKLSFCYELRPDRYTNGRQGFDLPADEILSTSEETFESVLEMIRTSRVLGYFD